MVKIRYTGDLGCKYRGIPHDMRHIYENKRFKIQRCQICNKRFKWNKGFKTRVENAEYLKANVRSFAQRNGATKRVFKKLYRPDECKIRL